MATPNEKQKRNEKELDPQLDYLFNTGVRCPYCHTRIIKYTSVCPRCGITKHQIHTASNKDAKEILKNKTGELVFMTRRKPSDISFTGMAVRCLVGGLFGWHCFFCGRYLRAKIMLISAIVGLILFILSYTTPLYIVREYFESIMLYDKKNLIPPWDMLVLVSFGLYALDFFCIVLGAFKYPVRLGEAKNAATKK